ncbi:hypothetical protein [Halopiger thermotolerans]
MKCTRCSESEAERMLVYYEGDAAVVVYLCQECAELALRDTEVTDLVPAPDW